MHTIHLIGLGRMPAKLAGMLVPDDIIVWNYGYTSKVIRRIRETEKSVTFLVTSEIGDSERTFKKTRLVAIQEIVKKS